MNRNNPCNPLANPDVNHPINEGIHAPYDHHPSMSRDRILHMQGYIARDVKRSLSTSSLTGSPLDDIPGFAGKVIATYDDTETEGKLKDFAGTVDMTLAGTVSPVPQEFLGFKKAKRIIFTPSANGTVRLLLKSSTGTDSGNTIHAPRTNNQHFHFTLSEDDDTPFAPIPFYVQYYGSDTLVDIYTTSGDITLFYAHDDWTNQSLIIPTEELTSADLVASYDMIDSFDDEGSLKIKDRVTGTYNATVTDATIGTETGTTLTGDGTVVDRALGESITMPTADGIISHRKEVEGEYPLVTIPDIPQEPEFNGSVIVVNWDGTGDYTTIQSAIDSATAGDIIEIRNGTYNEDVHHIKPVKLVGESSGGVIVDSLIVNHPNQVYENITSSHITVFPYPVIDTHLGIPGSLTEADITEPPVGAIPITNITELQNIALNGIYYLANDIDASETTDWNDGNGWIPIGNNTVSFTGKLYGMGHTITGLYSAGGNADGYGGLFGRASGSAIYDVGLVDYDITATASAGGLVGWNRDAVITNCYATGSVSTFHPTRTASAGGLVGWNRDSSAITNCYAIASVSGTYTGGLVGYNFNSATITNCYATGSAVGTSSTGGLVGYNFNSAITNCYATGSVSTTASAGGLVGRNQDAVITNCYATGSVSTTASAGGLVGLNRDAAINNPTNADVGWLRTTGTNTFSYYSVTANLVQIEDTSSVSFNVLVADTVTVGVDATLNADILITPTETTINHGTYYHIGLLSAPITEAKATATLADFVTVPVAPTTTNDDFLFRATDFDGVDQYGTATIPYGSEGTIVIRWSAFDLASTTRQTILSLYEDADNHTSLSIEGGDLILQHYDAGAVAETLTITPSNSDVQMTAITWDASALTLTNASRNASIVKQTGTAGIASGDLYIAQLGDDSQHAKMILRRLSMYDEVLTDEEIRILIEHNLQRTFAYAPNSSFALLNSDAMPSLATDDRYKVAQLYDGTEKLTAINDERIPLTGDVVNLHVLFRPTTGDDQEVFTKSDATTNILTLTYNATAKTLTASAEDGVSNKSVVISALEQRYICAHVKLKDDSIELYASDGLTSGIATASLSARQKDADLPVTIGDKLNGRIAELNIWEGEDDWMTDDHIINNIHREVGWK